MATEGTDAEQTDKVVTRLLNQMAVGDRGAEEQLVRVIYDELRRRARQQMRRERANHTLQATALVNEAYLRLVAQRDVNWESRAHFFAAASKVMRDILVDHARARRAEKRGGPQHQITLDDQLVAAKPMPVEVLALHEALERLAEMDERKSRLLELHYFGGLTFEEAARVLNTSVRTLKRDWDMARSWLRRELSRKTNDSG